MDPETTKLTDSAVSAETELIKRDSLEPGFYYPEILEGLYLPVALTPSEIRDFDAEVSVREDSLHDLQVRDPAKPSGYDKMHIENASKACASCPGHCCRAFVLAFSHEEMPGLIKNSRARLRSMKLKLAVLVRTDITLKEARKLHAAYPNENRRKASLRLEQEIAEESDNLKNLTFFLPRLLPARDLHVHPDQGYIKSVGPRVFRCAEFDEKTRRCKVHNKRPSICRRFICGAAAAGRVPADRNMLFGMIQIEKRRRRNGKTRA